MLMNLRNWLLTILLALTLGAGSGNAADLGRRGDLPADAAVEATRHYLANQTLLLMVRATFDVVEPGAIEADVLATARQLGAAGPSPEASAALDRRLLAEANYYIVSLRYVTLVGGAVWPGDKPESTYANDAIVQLDQLEGELAETIEGGGDALPLLEQVQDLWLLSEGLAAVPADRDRFAGRDEIVAQALAALRPRENT